MPTRSMEPLWSPAVATSGNRWQMRRRHKPQKQAKSVAPGCHRLPANFHGKEGVSGSSPEEGFEKFLLTSAGLTAPTWVRFVTTKTLENSRGF
jgi:hypothetical protein